MRERARDKGRLQDIVEYSNNVTMLIDGYSLERLVSDKRTYYSVMKNVEIVGEAAFMLSTAFKDAHPETPWKIVQGMRHVLVHDYANVISETLYDTAVNSIPVLRKQVEKYLATTNWGDGWRMPTNDDFQELVDNCDTAWITLNGVNGMLFTSRNNGRFIFLPAAGIRLDNDLYYADSFGYYWSSSLKLDDIADAWKLDFSQDSYSMDDYNLRRRCGRSVRPVCVPSSKKRK